RAARPTVGTSSTLFRAFVKEAAANEWSTRFFVDGTVVSGPDPMTFDSLGNLLTPANGEIAFPAYTPVTGAAPMSITMDMGGTKQDRKSTRLNSSHVNTT